MTRLDDRLAELVEFLKALQPPRTSPIVMIEMQGSDPLDPNGRLLLQADRFASAETYAARFEQLLDLGLPWINLSCIGVLHDKLVVAVEFPSPPSGRATRTSVNLAGPSRAVLDHDWDAGLVLSEL
jgi:hypothetical protein